MLEENVITDIETTLKRILEDPGTVQLQGRPVPVIFVTPDPDLVEITIPSMTLQLTDVRRDLSRMDNAREVEVDEPNGAATVRMPSQPYDLFYQLAGHAATGREDRLLLEQLLRFVDDHPALESQALKRPFRIHRDLTVRDLSRGRSLSKAVAFVVKTRLTGREVAERVPLVRELVTRVEQA